MEYLEIFQTVGGFVFALCFWLGCYKVEKVVTHFKS
nr:MAG TPA: hypothetical protein [Caudoviricetes sp.]